MKKRITILFLLMLVAVGTLYALSATSNAPNRNKNGFKRNFLPIEVHIAHQTEFPVSIRELAGMKGDSLFLMGPEPGQVYLTNTWLSKPKTIYLKDPKIKGMIPRFYSMVAYPEIFILGGNATSYALGNLRTGETQKVELKTKSIFDNPIMIDSIFVMRILNTKNLDCRFAVVSKTGEVLNREKDISQGKADGGMVYSGLLKYDSKTGMLVNLHFYDNGFEVFAKDLNLIKRNHTIDTVFHNPTKVTVKDGAVAYKHPPVAINAYTAVFEGKLYVRSKLIADNQDKSEFYANSCIDIYDIESGIYEGSFRLPNVNEEQINQFYFIAENTILAFSNKQVVVYQLKYKTFAKHNTKRNRCLPVLLNS